jgi:outer membrane protein TolC
MSRRFRILQASRRGRRGTQIGLPKFDSSVTRSHLHSVSSVACLKTFVLFRLTGFATKHLALFHRTAIDENRMPNSKKIHIPNRFVLGGCVSLLLVIASFAQSQTATPETQPSPGVETSPAASATPLIPQAEERTPAQPSPAASPAESTPLPPPLPTESPSPAQPAQAPISPLIPPAAGPGALPSPTPKPTLAPQTAQALDEQYQQSLQIRRIHPKDLLFISLLDAVRVAFYQNSDIRLAVEDAQAEKGALTTAMGSFDAKIIAGIGYGKSFTGPSQGAAATPNDVRRILNQSLSQVLTTLANNPNADIGALVANATTDASKQNIAQSITALFASFDVSKEFRNGVNLDFEYSPDLLDEEDQPTLPPVKHDLKVSLELPLTKLGTIFNDADEIAARKDYEASLLTLSHTATKAALQTVQSYWKASAALERFYIADRAFRISDSLLSLSQELVKGDAIPASELSLAQARRAEALSSRAAALLEVFTTSGDLAAAMGLQADQLKKLPLAYESFPAVPQNKLSTLSAENLTDLALARRFDRAAALKGIEAKRVLAEKAKIDMRPDLKFKGGVGVALIDNSATGNGGGYKAEPEFELGVGFNWPPANHSKKGALISAQSNLDKSVLSMESVSRSIASDILVNIYSLKEVSQQIEEAGISVGYYTKSLSDLRERFRLGATTLFETIQAEERLTTAANSLVTGKSTLAQEIAKLRFATATLVSKDVAYRIPGFPKPVERLQIARNSFVKLPDGNEDRGPLISDRNYESGHKPTPAPTSASAPRNR